MPKKRKPSPPLVPLTGKQKSYLRSLAHKLKPVVQIGHQGVTDGVLAALETALERHELLKLKVTGDAKVDAAEIAPRLTKATKSQLVQIIGHTLVVYRRRAENPKIVLPRVKPAKAGAAASGTARSAAASSQGSFAGADDDEDEDDDLDSEDDDGDFDDDDDGDEELE